MIEKTNKAKIKGIEFNICPVESLMLKEKTPLMSAFKNSIKVLKKE